MKTKKKSQSRFCDGIEYTIIPLSKPMQTNTCGTGLWTSEKKLVEIEQLGYRVIEGYGKDNTFYLMLNVFFNTRRWNIERHGLIYTDPRWLRHFNSELRRVFPKTLGKIRFDYTEQGMQGNNYVSLEGCKRFSFKELGRLIPDFDGN